MYSNYIKQMCWAAFSWMCYKFFNQLSCKILVYMWHSYCQNENGTLFMTQCIYYAYKIKWSTVMQHSRPVVLQQCPVFSCRIKADRPLMRDTLNAPWLLTKDNFNGLVMVIRDYHWLDLASRVLISTCSARLV